MNPRMLDAVQLYLVAAMRGFDLARGPQILEINRLPVSFLYLFSSSFLSY